MTRTSIISHAPDQQLVMIRQDYLIICDYDHCAAALLNVLEFWTNNKIENRKQAKIHNRILAEGGQLPTQNEELWIYKSVPEFQGDLLGLFGAKKISEALTELELKKFISTRNNPNYSWDRTLQYLLNIENVIASLHTAEMPDASRKNAVLKGAKTPHRSRKNAGAIPETTTETTTENKEILAEASDRTELKDSAPVGADSQSFPENEVVGAGEAQTEEEQQPQQAGGQVIPISAIEGKTNNGATLPDPKPPFPPAPLSPPPEQGKSSKKSATNGQSQHTPDENKAIAELIKAWLDGSQVIQPKAYNNNTIRGQALEMSRRALTPQHVTKYFEEKRKDTFWRDKSIDFQAMCKDIIPYLKARNLYTEPSAPAEPTSPPFAIDLVKGMAS